MLLANFVMTNGVGLAEQSAHYRQRVDSSKRFVMTFYVHACFDRRDSYVIFHGSDRNHYHNRLYQRLLLLHWYYIASLILRQYIIAIMVGDVRDHTFSSLDCLCLLRKGLIPPWARGQCKPMMQRHGLGSNALKAVVQIRAGADSAS